MVDVARIASTVIGFVVVATMLVPSKTRGRRCVNVVAFVPPLAIDTGKVTPVGHDVRHTSPVKQIVAADHPVVVPFVPIKVPEKKLEVVACVACKVVAKREVEVAFPS